VGKNLPAVFCQERYSDKISIVGKSADDCHCELRNKQRSELSEKVGEM